ncbi:MAG: nicotinamide-nucleotide amidohydrolase family protein [bacterium]
MGYYIYGVDGQSLEGVVAGLLLERRATISVAESCTGGLITSRLTDIPGSSKFLDHGVVVNSKRTKHDALRVPTKTLEEYGPVSPETRAMAERVRALGQTDLGLAVTGIMGPTGAMPERSSRFSATGPPRRS